MMVAENLLQQNPFWNPVESGNETGETNVRENRLVRAVGPIVGRVFDRVQGFRQGVTTRIDENLITVPVEHIVRFQKFGPILANLAMAIAVNSTIDDKALNTIKDGFDNLAIGMTEGLEDAKEGLTETIRNFADGLNSENGGDGNGFFGDANEVNFQEEDCVTPKRGDTPFKIWGSNWVKEAKEHGLTVNAGETGVDKFVAGETYCGVAKEVVQATPTPEPVATETVVPPPTPESTETASKIIGENVQQQDNSSADMNREPFGGIKLNPENGPLLIPAIGLALPLAGVLGWKIGKRFMTPSERRVAKAQQIAQDKADQELAAAIKAEQEHNHLVRSVIFGVADGLIRWLREKKEDAEYDAKNHWTPGPRDYE